MNTTFDPAIFEIMKQEIARRVEYRGDIRRYLYDSPVPYKTLLQDYAKELILKKTGYHGILTKDDIVLP